MYTFNQVFASVGKGLDSAFGSVLEGVGWAAGKLTQGFQSAYETAAVAVKQVATGVSRVAGIVGEQLSVLAGVIGATAVGAWKQVSSITAETVVDTLTFALALAGILLFLVTAGISGAILGAILSGKFLFVSSLTALAKMCSICLWAALGCDIAASVFLNFRDYIVTGIKSAYSAFVSAADVTLEAASSAASTAVATGRRLLTVDAVAVAPVGA